MMQPRIKVIHADYVTAKQIQTRLKHMGYDVPDMVLSVEESLVALGEERPDLVVLDAEIKGSPDSLEIAHSIENCQHIPVILISSDTDNSSLHRWGYYHCSFRAVKTKELSLMIDLILARHQFGKRLSEQEQILSEIMKSSSDAVITVEGDEQISFMNSVAERLTGWSYDEAATRHFSSLMKIVNEEGLEPKPLSLTSLMELHSCVDSNNHHLVTRTGSEVAINLRATPINGKGGTASKMLLIMKQRRDG
jgi:PAS domain S-box-containing protein